MREIFYKIGFIASGFFGLSFIVLALITLLPAEASKTNLLGYYSVCSWAPNSTISLIIFSSISLMIVGRL
jgi:hypothetical protein